MMNQNKDEIVEKGINNDIKSLNGGSSRKTYWNIFGTKFPKSQFIFFAQTILIYIVVSVSLYNLTNVNADKNNEKLWIAMLSSSVGYLLPNPTFSKFE